MGRLEGKSVYLTGGASGIGRAVLETFVAEGARVAVLDLSTERLAEIERQYAHEVRCVQGDVACYADHEKAVDTAIHAFGKLDVLVANAGVFDGFARFSDIPPPAMSEALQTMMNVNVHGYFFAAKAAAGALARAGGNMIFTVSGAGLYPDGGGVWYTASKHAQIGLMKQLAFELAPDIRVNAVSPGGTLTELQVIPPLRPYVSPVDPDTKANNVRRRNPLRIAMSPQDHTEAYVLLASDYARAITGEVIASDGGLSVRGLG